LLVLDSKVLSTASPAQLDLTAAAGNYLQLASLDIDPKCEQQFRDKMKLAKFPSNSADVVVLNVGGHCHQTTVGTLTGSSSYFSQLSGNDAVPTTVLDDGCFFIDRDGEAFGGLLAYMRSRWFRTNMAAVDLVGPLQ